MILFQTYKNSIRVINYKSEKNINKPVSLNSIKSNFNINFILRMLVGVSKSGTTNIF